MGYRIAYSFAGCYVVVGIIGSWGDADDLDGGGEFKGWFVFKVMGADMTVMEFVKAVSCTPVLFSIRASDFAREAERPDQAFSSCIL